MIDLAQHEGMPVARHAIAARQDLSADYLAQLLRLLRRARLVRAIRGRRGGYELARPAGEIPVGDVLRAVEGPLSVTDCVASSQVVHCGRASECLTRPL